MVKGPLVSVGLPVYNGENFLDETLKALRKQSYQNIEIVISDNGSTDKTQSICEFHSGEDVRIKYFRYDENRGAAWNYNNAFAKARGKYFMWAAHDDLHHADYVEKCVELLEERPEVVLCFSRTMFIDQDGNELYEFDYPVNLYTASTRLSFRRFAQGGHIVHEVFGLIRTDTLRNSPLIGGYHGSDLVLMAYLSLKGTFYQLDEVLFYHREHAKRSMKDPQGAKNVTQWFDSKKSGKYVLPHWKRTLENSKLLIVENDLSVAQKVVGLVDLLRLMYWHKRIFWAELVVFLKAFVFRR